MQTLQYNRQKLYYKWALVLGIIALFGYTFYFEFETYVGGFSLFTDNISLHIRISLIIYFLFLLISINKIPNSIFRYLGFLIAVPLGWSVSIISFLTVGYAGITVTGYIFIILASAVVFDFTLISFTIALFSILSFHFTILSFYPKLQPEGLFNHIFILGLSSFLGLTINYLVNIIRENEARVLQERELLLKEIHHRVKNNLQVISSLLDLQSGSIPDENTKTIVKEGQSRVKSMALIHQLLYQTDSFTRIDFARYLEQLLTILHNTYKKPDKEIKYLIRAENMHLDIDLAVPLGLITNELVTNAYKYAFPDTKELKIDVELKNTGSDKYQLKVSDNGKGLPKEFNLDKTNTLGLRLVKILTKQIAGSIEIIQNKGVAFEINFSIPLKTN